MSIIIGKQIKNTILFLSDTKVSVDIGDKTVTGINKIRFDPLQGVLKTYILFNKVCISFSGIVDNACSILKDMLISKPTNIPDYLKSKLKILNDKDTEFLVGLRFKDQSLMFRVNYFNIEISKSTWTGDKNAFNEFQINYHSIKDNSNEFSKSQQAFENLIRNPPVPTIGDFSIETIFKVEYESFIYCKKLTGFRGGKTLNIQAGKSKFIDEGHIADGSYMVTNLVSNSTSNPAVAIYFPQVKFGLLFIPIDALKRNGKGELYKNLSIYEFIEKVKKNYGINLFGWNFNNGKIEKVFLKTPH
jgi:hypothetical protein